MDYPVSDQHPFQEFKDQDSPGPEKFILLPVDTKASNHRKWDVPESLQSVTDTKKIAEAEEREPQIKRVSP